MGKQQLLNIWKKMWEVSPFLHRDLMKNEDRHQNIKHNLSWGLNIPLPGSFAQGKCWVDKKNDSIGIPIQIWLQTWLFKDSLDIYISTLKKKLLWLKGCKSFILNSLKIQLKNMWVVLFLLSFFSLHCVFMEWLKWVSQKYKCQRI
jgi:hypothetical protein